MRKSLKAWAPALLALVLFIAYLPSLGAGFLNYDDPWLIADNPYFKSASSKALSAILFDLSHDTRMRLGAEYLPVRDLSHWLEARVFGLSAPAMRLVQLLLYIGAMLAFRVALTRTLSSHWVAEVAVWLFALHPVHVESVAWLAGRKDVLALLFVGLALQVHAGSHRYRKLLVPAAFALACLSKSMAVGSLGLFLAWDLVRQRKPERDVYLGLLATAALVLALHVSVGRVVSMTTTPAGGTRYTAWLTMGGIWLEYLRLCVWPAALSVSHDAVVKTAVDFVALAGWFVVATWGALGVWSWRRKQPWPLALWLTFVVPLAPVSQVIFPLENLIADRYLFLSVLAPCLALALLSARARGAVALPSTVLVGLLLCVTTALRASVFADPVALFSDATEKTRTNAVAPYQLGQALEARGRPELALAAYLTALAREPRPSEATRRATNNAARLLAREDHLDEAEQLLVRGRTLWPSDPKILANLARLRALQARLNEACALSDELARRFPKYAFRPEWAPECRAR